MQITLDVVTSFSLAVRFVADTNNLITASQRIYQYTQLESEDELIKTKDKEISSWPENGQIELKSLTMKYRETMEPSISNLSVKI